MITEFDKSGAVALYRREFAEYLAAMDYESAFDTLLKFTQATENPEFHLACGMLYVLMTQDSDDNELLTLAFREFMIYLQYVPDSRPAYRNLLAVSFLRRDPIAVISFSERIKQLGLDLETMIDELTSVGINVYNDDENYLSIDSLFAPGEFGAVENIAENKCSAGETGVDSAPRDSKIIKFKGNSELGSETVQTKGKIIRIDEDPYEQLTDRRTEFGDMFDFMLKAVKDDADISTSGGDELDGSDVSDGSDTDKSDIGSKFALREAERFCDMREFDKALESLRGVVKDGGRLHYCAECVRSNIYMELADYGAAQSALDRAYAIVRDGSLVGTLQCRLYELEEKYSLIPSVLKRIDVADYVDADHVYRAMWLAVKYCNEQDALELAEEYVEEFNTLDVRLLYAQLLYNAGDRKTAKKEFYMLSRVLYDDFNAQYYYLSAVSDVDKMPVSDEVPQSVLGMLIDNLISVVHSDVFFADDEILNSEPFGYCLEIFLTLEYDNSRSVMKLMFETLKILAADTRSTQRMKNALVSPYVEPLVKAVILSELAARGEKDLLTESVFCPVSLGGLPSLGKGYSKGFYAAYALTAVFLRRSLPSFVSLSSKLKPIFERLGTDERDVANYIWRTVRSDAEFTDKNAEGRIAFALGYSTKAEANAAFRSVCASLAEYGITVRKKHNRKQPSGEK